MLINNSEKSIFLEALTVTTILLIRLLKIIIIYKYSVFVIFKVIFNDCCLMVVFSDWKEKSMKIYYAAMNVFSLVNLSFGSTGYT